MREIIKYVDSDHKFGKTIIFMNPEEDVKHYAYKDQKCTTIFAPDELMSACINGSIVKIMNDNVYLMPIGYGITTGSSDNKIVCKAFINNSDLIDIYSKETDIKE